LKNFLVIDDFFYNRPKNAMPRSLSSISDKFNQFGNNTTALEKKTSLFAIFEK